MNILHVFLFHIQVQLLSGDSLNYLYEHGFGLGKCYSAPFFTKGKRWFQNFMQKWVFLLFDTRYTILDANLEERVILELCYVSVLLF